MARWHGGCRQRAPPQPVQAAGIERVRRDRDAGGGHTRQRVEQLPRRPASGLVMIDVLPPLNEANTSAPRSAKETANVRPTPKSANVHGDCPRSLRKTPPVLAPTTHRLPVQIAVSGARPAANRSFKSSDSVQSGCPGSRKNTWPLKPAEARSRVPPTAMACMLVDWAGPNALPKRVHVPPLRFRIQGPSPTVAAYRLLPSINRSAMAKLRVAEASDEPWLKSEPGLAPVVAGKHAATQSAGIEAAPAHSRRIDLKMPEATVEGASTWHRSPC